MAYQVGYGCYATLADASAAACSRFEPLTALSNNGTTFTTLSCAAPYSNGDLIIKTSTVNLNGTGLLEAVAWSKQVYQPCLYSDFVAAGIQIFVAILTAWVGWFCVKWLYTYFNGWIHWSRGDDK